MIAAGAFFLYLLLLQTNQTTSASSYAHHYIDARLKSLSKKLTDTDTDSKLCNSLFRRYNWQVNSG